ncbi:hypothetical protein MHBO_003451 [Bonamia ostreae]|uniref:Kinetochore protein Spc24 n=1 Tax=Bonamia ostreae TaxID=126728 RepID=A0ABV2AR95_9EUKA
MSDLSLKQSIDLMRQIRLSLKDTSEFEEISERYLTAQKMSYINRYKHYEVLEKAIKRLQDENNQLKNNLNSKKIKKPSNQKIDLRKEKNNLIENIKNLKTQIENQKLTLSEYEQKTAEIDSETKKFKNYINKNVPTSINKLNLYDNIANIKLVEMNNDKHIHIIEKNGSTNSKILFDESGFEITQKLWNEIE